MDDMMAGDYGDEGGDAPGKVVSKTTIAKGKPAKELLRRMLGDTLGLVRDTAGGPKGEAEDEGEVPNVPGELKADCLGSPDDEYYCHLETLGEGKSEISFPNIGWAVALNGKEKPVVTALDEGMSEHHKRVGKMLFASKMEGKAGSPTGSGKMNRNPEDDGFRARLEKERREKSSSMARPDAIFGR